MQSSEDKLICCEPGCSTVTKICCPHCIIGGPHRFHNSRYFAEVQKEQQGPKSQNSQQMSDLNAMTAQKTTQKSFQNFYVEKLNESIDHQQEAIHCYQVYCNKLIKEVIQSKEIIDNHIREANEIMLKTFKSDLNQINKRADQKFPTVNPNSSPLNNSSKIQQLSSEDQEILKSKTLDHTKSQNKQQLKSTEKEKQSKKSEENDRMEEESHTISNSKKGEVSSSDKPLVQFPSLLNPCLQIQEKNNDINLLNSPEIRQYHSSMDNCKEMTILLNDQTKQIQSKTNNFPLFIENFSQHNNIVINMLKDFQLQICQILQKQEFLQYQNLPIAKSPYNNKVSFELSTLPSITQQSKSVQNSPSVSFTPHMHSAFSYHQSPQITFLNQLNTPSQHSLQKQAMQSQTQPLFSFCLNDQNNKFFMDKKDDITPFLNKNHTNQSTDAQRKFSLPVIPSSQQKITRTQSFTHHQSKKPKSIFQTLKKKQQQSPIQKIQTQSQQQQSEGKDCEKSQNQQQLQQTQVSIQEEKSESEEVKVNSKNNIFLDQLHQQLRSLSCQTTSSPKIIPDSSLQCKNEQNKSKQLDQEEDEVHQDQDENVSTITSLTLSENGNVTKKINKSYNKKVEKKSTIVLIQNQDNENNTQNRTKAKSAGIAKTFDLFSINCSSPSQYQTNDCCQIVENVDTLSQDEYCIFCAQSLKDSNSNLGSVYGPITLQNKSELIQQIGKKQVYFHQLCATYNSGVDQICKNQILGVNCQLDQSKDILCQICNKNFAGVKCAQSNCEANFHYQCILDNKQKMEIDVENESVYCKLHQGSDDVEEESK